MKTCPHCSAAYRDDYLFCLTDGNTLLDESGEQETLVAGRVTFSEMPKGFPGESTIGCAACEFANPSNSQFCNNCGKPVIAVIASGQAAAHEPFGFVPMGVNPTFPPSQPAFEETRAFQPQVFTPPGVSGQQQASADRQRTQTNVWIGCAVACVAIIIGLLIYISQPGSPKAVSNSAGLNTKKAASIIGQKGHLTTNQNIRSDSNRSSETLGVHYQGAKIQILDEKTYTTDDGSITTWYRVRVLENGCDREGTRGCGNDLNDVPGQAATEGWMNAKFIGID